MIDENSLFKFQETLLEDVQKRKLRKLRNSLEVFGYSIYADVKVYCDDPNIPHKLFDPKLPIKISQLMQSIQEFKALQFEETMLLEQMLICIQSKTIFRLNNLLDRFLVIVGNFPPDIRDRKLQETKFYL